MIDVPAVDAQLDRGWWVTPGLPPACAGAGAVPADQSCRKAPLTCVPQKARCRVGYPDL
jgi:hypothetical protein